MDFEPNVLKKLPIIVTKASVIFPLSEISLQIERSYSLKSFNEANDNYEGYCIIACQKNNFNGKINSDTDISSVATLCKILDFRLLTKGDAVRARVSGISRFKISSFYLENDPFMAEGNVIKDENDDSIEVSDSIKAIMDYSSRIGPDKVFKNPDRSFINKIQSGVDAVSFSYLVSDAINVPVDKKLELLKEDSLLERLKDILKDIRYIQESEDVEVRINNIVRENAEKSQKEYILREKLRAINKELGDDDSVFETEVNRKLNENPYPKEVKDKIDYELRRINTMPQGSLEGALIKDYINTVLAVPWFEKSEDNTDILKVKEILDEDHYGLKKVKDRILEYIAVKTIKNNLKSPILCLYGPPGCGKTSLAISIARALNRKFIKCSLGGIDDEAQIRGHIRTYVGSRPGIIIDSLKKAKVTNPVFLLDEIDKLGRNGYKGDPSSALLEVLDPEQNTKFNDHYLEVNYDLSNVLFICTANNLNDIPEPLMDRLELIEVESYTLIDKVHIAKEFLIKKELENNGLNDKNIKFSDDAIEYIIERYTREAGVRDLERKISDCLRKVCILILENKIKDSKTITKTDVKKFLGMEDFDPQNKESKPQVGVMTGLAYSTTGGSIISIEASTYKGHGELKLTGKLGDVMKESCAVALGFIKSNSSILGIDLEELENTSIQLHFPEGAISKDGPSAGCAIACAMVSAIKNIPISQDYSMTGEITLRGKSLAIGGLKEKTLAALRSGIKKVFVPLENKKTVEELPKEIRNNIEFVYMENVLDAIKIIFNL